jgi:hypothetical protein
MRTSLVAVSLLSLAVGAACAPQGTARTGAASRASPAASPGADSTAAASSDPLRPPSTPEPGPAVSSDLVLTGALSGRAQSAQPLGACGAGPAGFAVSLRFTLSGKPYVLSVDILQYHGAGHYTIPPQRVAVRSEAQSGAPNFLPATAGGVDVDAGESSGKLDASLGSDGASHVRGSWACR